MGYVSHCNKHGQYKGDYCEDCIDELRKENTKLREALKKIADGDVAQSSIKGNVDEAYQQIKIEREKMIYKAPTSGFYQVSAEATTYEPTGEFETVSNPKYKWYTPWRPKTVTREKYKKVVHEVGLKTIHLKQGESIGSKHVLVRIGGIS